MATAAANRHSELKRMLEQRRYAILNDVIEGVREASEVTRLARAGEVLDTADEGEAVLQDAVRFALINMKTALVSHIDQALARLAQGNYGACGDCGGDIAESRLRALPFAVRCRQCEELREDIERHSWGARARNWRDRELSDPSSLAEYEYA